MQTYDLFALAITMADRHALRGLRLRSPESQWLPGFTSHGPAALLVELLPV